MSRWRIVVVACLLLIPAALLMAVGSYYLWTLPLGFLVWWLLTAVIAAGISIAWYWQRHRVLLRPPSFESPVHWTDRDQRAWKLVEARAKAAEKLDPALLSDIQHYLQITQEMATELAVFYHPKAQDPVGNLTIPEILAVAELASHDLSEMVDRYLPGGHLLTINDWRRARQAADWYKTASNAYWAVSALFSPVNTALRYVASQVGLSTPMQMLQQNLLLWFHTAYLHRVGSYLIDLHSGRLRVGATRYRQLVEQTLGPAPPAAPAGAEAVPEAAEQVRRVTIALLGQVKAGKSSLINALVGEQKAVTDVLPATDGVERYEVHPEGVDNRLVLLDTPGYGHTGPRADQLAATQEAARQSDLLLLVLHARNPARQPDLTMLEQLRAWFVARPELKMPPVLAVVTHIDLLSPAMEWTPPYNWQKPARPKEKNIHDALAAVRDQLGEYLADIVPVCTAPGKVLGVEEWLLPAVMQRVSEGLGVALLRVLRAERDTGKIRKVFDQLATSGREAARILWRGLMK